MKRKITVTLVVLALISALGGNGYLWQIKTELEENIASLTHDLDTTNRKLNSALKKYRQEKAKLVTCMQSKIAAEARIGRLESEIVVLESEKEKLVAGKAAVEAALLAQSQEFKAKMVKVKEYREKMAEKYTALVEKYKKAVSLNRDKSEQIAVLEAEAEELAAKLNQTESHLDRSLKHNEKLCVIAEELTEKYRAKTGSSEPFTKIRMVELEHMLQDYLKRIDKEKIIEQ